MIPDWLRAVASGEGRSRLACPVDGVRHDPLHREDDLLLAYAGRAVDNELAKEKGKYKLPEGFKKCQSSITQGFKNPDDAQVNHEQAPEAEEAGSDSWFFGISAH